MTTRCALLAVLVGLLMSAGCSVRQEEKVVFHVDGLRFDTGDLKRESAFQLALYKMRNPKATGEKIQAAERKVVGRILATKLDELLLRRRMETAGAGCDKSILEKGKEKFGHVYGGRSRAYDTALAEVRRCGGTAEDVERKLTLESGVETFLRRDFKDRLAVSQQQVDETIASMKRGDAKAAATNVVIYALASNVWKRASTGEDFAKLAARYSDLRNEEGGIDMGEKCDASDFSVEEPSVWHAVSLLEPGRVTAPISTSEGLTVFKCLAKQHDETAQGDYWYHLQRIVFHRALLYDNYDPGYVRYELSKEFRQKVMNGILAEQKKVSKISFGPGAAEVIPPNFDEYYLKRYGIKLDRPKRSQKKGGEK